MALSSELQCGVLNKICLTLIGPDKRRRFGLTAEYPATPKHVLKTVATRLLRYHREPNYRIPCHCPIKTCRPSERESNICLSRSKNISFEQKRYHFMFLSFFNRIARAKRIAFYVSLVLKAYRPSKEDSILCFSRS